MSLMWKLPPKNEPRAILSVICKWQEFYLLVSGVNRHLPAALTSNCAFPGMHEKSGKCSQSLGKLHIPYLRWLCSPNKNNMSKTCLSDLSIISPRLERNHTWYWAIRTFHGWPPSQTPTIPLQSHIVIHFLPRGALFFSWKTLRWGNSFFPFWRIVLYPEKMEIIDMGRGWIRDIYLMLAYGENCIKLQINKRFLFLFING